MGVNHDGKVTIGTGLNNKGLMADIKGISGPLGGLAKTVGKTALTITAAFGAAAAAITKQSVDAYADYEQLTGGVETLFKNSADKVRKYAENAFYTANMSSNAYMETVTSFSAGLISSLSGDTEKAADIANMAVIDMADNANKMGTPLENVKTAYAGFAKQQYMLLDNLKLGYGGTKTEMQRLLKDAEAFSGVKYDINNLGDVYSAIHAIQEKLGVAGATAEEAEKTITGSANMTKAAWKNVLTAIGGGGDLDKAINNLVYSVSKYFKNIVPVVERSLSGIGQLIEKIAPQLVQTVATALIKSLPSLLNAVYQMIVGLANGIYQGIVALFRGESASTEATAQINSVTKAAEGAASAENKLASGISAANKAAKKAVAGFDELNILQDKTGGSADGVAGASFGATTSTKTNIAEETAKKAIPWVEEFLENLQPIKDGFNDAFTADIPKLKKNWGKVITSLNDTFSDPKVKEAFSTLRKEASTTSGKIVGSVSSIATSFASGVVGGVGDATDSLKDFNKVKLTSITKNVTTVTKTTGELAESAADVASIFDGKNFQGVVEFLAMLADVTLMESLDGVTGFFSDMYNFFAKPLIDNSDEIREIGDKVMEIINLILEPGKELIDKLAENTTKWEDTAIHKFFVDLTDFASLKLGKNLDKVSAFLDDIIAFLKGENDLGKWFSENVTPTFSVEKWETELSNIETAFGNVWTNVETFWNTSLPNWWRDNVAPWFTADKWEELFTNVKTGFKNGWGKVTSWWENFSISDWWENDVSPWFTVEKWEELWEDVKTGFENGWKPIKEWWDNSALGKLMASVDDFFDDEKWETKMHPLSGVFRDAFTDAANAAIKVLNDMIGWINKQLKFTIPTLSIDGTKIITKKEVTLAKVPKIPYLAQGAVLPPNKPFMAMVGDQRHGTNIEAPLATIQEAVALVMQDYAASNIAGHEATVAVLREILEAVLGISIGDDVIANAVNRYQAKMAIVKGVHV